MYKMSNQEIEIILNLPYYAFPLAYKNPIKLLNFKFNHDLQLISMRKNSVTLRFSIRRIFQQVVVKKGLLVGSH